MLMKRVLLDVLFRIVWIMKNTKICINNALFLIYRMARRLQIAKMGTTNRAKEILESVIDDLEKLQKLMETLK